MPFAHAPLHRWGASLARPYTALYNKRQLSVMAQAARTIYVKGDPVNKILGDCPFCHRTLLTLELKGMEYDKDYIDFSNKPQWLFERNEKGQVPIMDDGGKWIADSGTICEYLDENYPPSLGPCSTPVGEKLLPTFKNFLESEPGTDEFVEKASAFVGQLDEIEDYLAKNGPFLAGAEMGAADALLFPRMYHARTALPHFIGWSFPDKYTNIFSYMSAVMDTQAFKNTDYGGEMIIKGWEGHGISKKVQTGLRASKRNLSERVQFGLNLDRIPTLLSVADASELFRFVN
eukprot:TRINITY_DN6368_c0_g2_i1.p1 TRINITY_DN6368_c0_g2~~TRINITY_DN6368_c0_g2_i1.p1  ORF type:complete len:289 (-),score=30.25 TRINITY_DN6368_c0_g2_i1:210-1076(-)